MVEQTRQAVPLDSPTCRGEQARPGWAGLLARGWRKPAGIVVLGSTVALLSAVVVGVEGGSAWTKEAPAISLGEPRVVVLKSKRMLHLLDGETLIRSYPIDLGFAPAGQKQRQGDGRTPVGAFRVVTKNAKSPYHRFLGIDYPDDGALERGLWQGLISRGEAASIRSALRGGRCPDWGTALGGGIGIHGGRTGRDTTAGCIALSDKHVDELFSVLRIGDSVEIQP